VEGYRDIGINSLLLLKKEGQKSLERSKSNINKPGDSSA
jgi:hypothetical protein